MKDVETYNPAIDFNFIISFVKNSNFFADIEPDPRCKRLKSLISREIDLKHMNLPQRLQHYINENHISSLTELLDNDPIPLLRKRNLGKKSIIEAKKTILSYLYENEANLNNICKKIASDDSYYSHNMIEKYFPLLQGIFKTTAFYFHYIDKDISYIKIPKRIKKYIDERPNIKTLNDILKIRYNELRRINNIGDRTIKTLQYTLIELLRLEKVASVPAIKNRPYKIYLNC